MFDYFYGQSGEMFSYFRVPQILFRDIKFKDLSTDAKTLYGILLDRMGLSVKNGWLDEQGRVYIIFPVQEVMDALGCADNKATKLFRELEKFGLIERKRRGLGKPNLIYVKNFADPRFRNREKNGSGAADSAQQKTAKSRGNKTEWNKTEGSEPDPFSSDAEDEPDERTRLEAYFMQSLEVDLLLRVCPDEEDTIDQIVNAPEAAARQIDDIVFGIHIGDLLVGPVKSRSVHVCFLSALFLRHSLLPDSAAAEQQHRGEKQCQYASIHRVSSFQGNQDSLRPFERHGQCSGAQQALF